MRFASTWTAHEEAARCPLHDNCVKGSPGPLIDEQVHSGKAAVYIDGRRRATVDTFDSARAHRQIVWETGLSSGTHTIKVVNLATPGHPRIDIDGVVIH